MDPLLIDVAILISGLLSGWAFGRFWDKKSPEVVTITREVAPPPLPQPELHVSPGRQAVVFRFANGLEHRKVLFKHSLDYDMIWKEQRFALAPDAEGNALVYNEVVWPAELERLG